MVAQQLGHPDFARTVALGLTYPRFGAPLSLPVLRWPHSRDGSFGIHGFGIESMRSPPARWKSGDPDARPKVGLMAEV